MTTTLILKCLAIGVVSGIIAALCGVGGGVVMVPAFVLLLDMPQKTAVATP
ncbi:MAG: TSUP family transporter [Verrucomicrobiaceae bacterium]|nr:TSUP family transporter [Verrucomicrobiaceae bacterium]